MNIELRDQLAKQFNGEDLEDFLQLVELYHSESNLEFIEKIQTVQVDVFESLCEYLLKKDVKPISIEELAQIIGKEIAQEYSKYFEKHPKMLKLFLAEVGQSFLYDDEILVRYSNRMNRITKKILRVFRDRLDEAFM